LIDIGFSVDKTVLKSKKRDKSSKLQNQEKAVLIKNNAVLPKKCKHLALLND
jgi:hypothetical protein